MFRFFVIKLEGGYVTISFVFLNSCEPIIETVEGEFISTSFFYICSCATMLHKINKLVKP